MKLPNWFKIAWWFLLTALLTAFLSQRYPALIAGSAKTADIVVFVIWIALLLAPLFNEVSLLGITLKQQLDDLKTFVTSQVTEVKSELRNAVDVRTTISPQFYMPPPATDAQLPELETKIKAAVADALRMHGVTQEETIASFTTPSDVSMLFFSRFNIERELRRIAEGQQVTSGIETLQRKPASIFQITRFLAQTERIEPELAGAIREVYSVCSPAVHGEQVTEAQLNFVRDVAPGLIAALQAVR